MRFIQAKVQLAFSTVALVLIGIVVMAACIALLIGPIILLNRVIQ